MMNEKKNRYGIRKSDMDAMKVYLKRHGIPDSMINQIRLAFINDAVRESNDMKYDRIFAAIALASNRAFGFGRKRIVKLLHAFDDLAGYIGENNEEYDWTSCMEELHERTGLLVRTNEENRVVLEYVPEGNYEDIT